MEPENSGTFGRLKNPCHTNLDLTLHKALNQIGEKMLFITKIGPIYLQFTIFSTPLSLPQEHNQGQDRLIHELCGTGVNQCLLFQMQRLNSIFWDCQSQSNPINFGL